MRALPTALGLLLAIAATPALADTTVTPSAGVTTLATDNAGSRSPTQAPQRDAITTVQAGGDVLYSRPLWALRLSALGEYERYLSAAVRNTYAAGGLDGRWRPDERTSVRSTLRASYAPDRYDPRVPYRLIAAAPAGASLPLFVRATTTKVTETAYAERWLTELVRGRITGEWGTLRYADRRAVGPEPGAIPARYLQGRSAGSLELATLRQVTEAGALGVYGSGARADYEAGPSVYTADAGGIAEWNVSEKILFAAKAGAQYVDVPGPHGVPSHTGWRGELSLKRTWVRGSVEALASDGVSLTTGALPASEERTGRLGATVLPLDVLEANAYGAITRERSMFPEYRATGTATIWSVGGSLGWRMTEHWKGTLGLDHTRQEARGLVEIPYQANTVFVGFTFAGLSLGDPPVLP